MSNSYEERSKICLNNSNRGSKSPHAIESLLSLDNTLLCSVETGSELSQEHDDPTTGVMRTQRDKVDGTPAYKIRRSVSPDANEWQDRTLMDQVFAQFDLQNEKVEIASDSYGSINGSDIFDTFYKEDANPEPVDIRTAESAAGTKCLSKPNTTNMSQDELFRMSGLNISNFGDDSLKDDCFELPLKPKVDDKSPVLETKFNALYKCKFPRKKLRLNDTTLKSEQVKSEEIHSTECLFYGLSDAVKKLIQEVKGIHELYRKLDITIRF